MDPPKFLIGPNTWCKIPCNCYKNICDNNDIGIQVLGFEIHEPEHTQTWIEKLNGHNAASESSTHIR